MAVFFSCAMIYTVQNNTLPAEYKQGRQNSFSIEGAQLDFLSTIPTPIIYLQKTMKNINFRNLGGSSPPTFPVSAILDIKHQPYIVPTFPYSLKGTNTPHASPSTYLCYSSSRNKHSGICHKEILILLLRKLQ